MVFLPFLSVSIQLSEDVNGNLRAVPDPPTPNQKNTVGVFGQEENLFNLNCCLFTVTATCCSDLPADKNMSRPLCVDILNKN